MAEWFQCVCEFLRAQSGSLAGVMQSLSNQNTISDMNDIVGNDSIQQHLNGNGSSSNGGELLSVGGVGVTPMQVFMVVLAVMWTYMFLFAQMNKDPVKPTNAGGYAGDDKNNEESKRDGHGGEPPVA